MKGLYGVLFLFIGACHPRPDKGFVQAEIQEVSTKSQAVTTKQNRTWISPNEVHISNDFEGAGRMEVSFDGDTIVVVVLPENLPINNSPWYAFKIWSNSTAENWPWIKLIYKGGMHRYNPIYSTDGQSWSSIQKLILQDFKPAEDQQVLAQSCMFQLPVTQDTTLVSAQELRTRATEDVWFNELAVLPHAEQLNFGYSTEGRPIRAIAFGNLESDRVLLILGRQHPPEVTGYEAMKVFGQELLKSENQQALEFREKHCIVWVPTVNPDGVASGNWRHNAAGVDLNRDWQAFKQPETRAIRDGIDSLVQSTTDRKLSAVIDFHSTWTDIYYVIPGGADSLIQPMIELSNERCGTKANINVRPKGEVPVTAMAYFHNKYRAETLTYEVSDTTAQSVYKWKSNAAASSLMDIMNSRP